MTGENGAIAFVDQGYSGAQAAQDARSPIASWKWGSSPKQKRALWCSPDAGSSSGVLLGRLAFGVSCVIMNAYQKP